MLLSHWMNACLVELSSLSPLLLLMTKVSLLLVLTWLIQIALIRANPRFRVFLWRSTVLGLFMLFAWGFMLPTLEFQVQLPHASPSTPSILSPPATVPIAPELFTPSENDLPQTDHSPLIESHATVPAKSISVVIETTQTTSPSEPLQASIPWESVFLGIWGIGFALLVIRMGLGFVRLNTLMKSSLPAEEHIVKQAQQINIALGYHQKTEIRTSSQFAVPVIYGLLRPVVVLPERMCDPSRSEELPAILAHELTHANNWDVMWNVVVCMMRNVLWFHPLLWKVASVHQAACDSVCDAVSADYLGDTQAYCRTLARVALEANDLGCVGVLCMAHSCDVRRRIAALQNEIHATHLRRRTIATITTFGLITVSILAGARITPVVAQEETSIVKEVNQAVEVTEPPVAAKSTSETQFIINDEKGKAVPTGMIQVTGKTDQGHYFDTKIPIKQGRAVMKFKRPNLTEFTLKINAPNFQNYLRKYEPKKARRTFTVADQYTYQLRNAITIGGTVLDDKGHPLKDVRVYYYLPSQGRIEEGIHTAEGWLTTEADGKWSTSTVPYDLSHLTIRFHLAWYESKNSLGRFSGPAVFHKDFAKLRAKTCEHVLHKIPLVEGSVVTPQGNPIENVVVRYSGWNSGFDEAQNRGNVIKTNNKGKFHIPQPRDLMRSRFSNQNEILKLTFQHPEWADKQYSQEIPLTEPIHVVMKKGKRIEFLAIDTEGKPIKGIVFIPEFIIPEFRGKTDSDGRWVWKNAHDEVIHYQIISSTYLCQPPGSDFGPDDSPVTLKFRKNIPVIGTVVDAETGKSIADFRLYKGNHFKSNRSVSWDWNPEVSQRLRPVKGSWAEGLVDEDSGSSIESGRFLTRLMTLDRLYKYRIEADGYIPQVSRQLDAALLPSEPIKLEFRLQKRKEL